MTTDSQRNSRALAEAVLVARGASGADADATLPVIVFSAQHGESEEKALEPGCPGLPRQTGADAVLLRAGSRGLKREQHLNAQPVARRARAKRSPLTIAAASPIGVFLAPERATRVEDSDPRRQPRQRLRENCDSAHRETRARGDRARVARGSRAASGAGFDCYVTKPVDIRRFPDQVQGAIAEAAPAA
jgi:hypothetical protein